MDWSDLGAIIKPLAPLLGGVLGGPIGSAAGGVIGNLLGDALGVEPTPEAINNAINLDPQAADKIREVEAAKGASIAEMEAKMLESVNVTARQELQSESAFIRFARPFSIWVIGLVTGGYGGCLVAATVAAVRGDPAALNLLVTNAGVLGIALAPCGAVAGVASWGRTKEKIAGVAGPLAEITKAVTSGVGAVRSRASGR